jgi:WD40 repeat protein
MPDNNAHRRYLIAIGITVDLPKTGPRIVDSVNRMTRVFTDDFGYERVTLLDIDPATDQIRKSIREFCLNCKPDDIVTLYYTGHADKVNETHRVWTGDTIDSISGPLETKYLAELMLVDTPLRYALIILDTCFAAQGGAEALRGSISSIGEGDGKTLALLTAAYPREQIRAGDFARLFEHVVEQPAVAGHEPPYLALGTIASLIKKITKDSEREWQTVSYNLLGARTDLLPFLPNPRFNVQLHGLDLLTQLRIEQQDLRVDDLRLHFLPRARGVDVPAEPGWRFVGREAALRDLVSWLKNSDDLSARVVTGGPGSGKSAVISRLVVLSDPDWRRIVPMEDLAADTIPPEGIIATGIHARGLTNAQVLAAICAAVGVRVDLPADLLREMQGRRFTVAIDAIDEALDPAGLVSTILLPLVEAGPAQGLRLLLGTRPHLLKSLGMTGLAVDLDDEHYADPASLYDYVVRGLESDNPQSPYHSAPEDLVAAVAKAVAEAADHSFLVALIVSRTLRHSTEIPDPNDPVWRAALPATAAAAMHSDLETRLGAEADRARDLLRPLAFAYGAGLPWEDLWAPLSSKISGRDYTDEDLIWLRRQAGSYVVEAMESGHSVYRLYHAALAEYLRQGCDEGHIHNLFSAFLMDRVPGSRSELDWSRAHPPYILAHLATHAQRAGILDGLLLDPGYLVNAVPAGLMAALPAARDPDAELAGRAYQRAAHQLRNQPEDDRLSYLELASRITHAARLTERIAVSAPHRRWSVPWTHWPPEHPHRILDGQLGLVNGVICADPGDGNPVVASIGQDAKLRIWDVATAEPRGTYTVGGAPLLAVRAVRLPEQRTVIVLLAADGMLHTWDMSTAALLRTIPVAPLWRRMAWLRNANLTLRCLGTPDGRQFAITGGRGIRTSIWDLSSGRRVAILPGRATPAAIEFIELIDGRTVIAASMGGTERRLCDLQTGQELPYERRRIRFAWLRSLYDGLIRGSNITYYAFRSGPPLAAVRFFRRTAMVWDLTASRPLGTWPRGKTGAQVTLTDGRVVTVPLPLPQRKFLWSFRLGRLRMASQSYQPAEGPDSLVPLDSPGRRPGQPDDERRESLSLGFEMTDRFLRVLFHDYLGKPDRGAISLTLAGHTADVTGYDWTRLSDGHVIVITGSRDGTVRRWDISSITPGTSEGNEQGRVALHRIVSVPLEDGTPVGLTVADGVDVAIWDLRTGELIGDLTGREVPPCAICVARPRERPPIAVTFDTDQTMRIWSLPDGHQTAEFPDDWIRWPGDATCARLPDGTCVAVTSGHGRKTVVWDLATGRIRNVLTGHKGWSACVACVEGRGLWPLALTGGLDNRVNVWGLHRGQWHHRFRIVSPWNFLIRPSTGRAHSVSAMALDSGRLLVLVATSDGTVRALEPRRFPLGARRAGTVPAHAVGTATLSNGQAVVVTATDGGIIRIWKPEALTRRGDDRAPLCGINIEVPVSDISFIDHDTFIIATPNGLTAIRLTARLLETYVSSLEPEQFQHIATHAGS